MHRRSLASLATAALMGAAAVAVIPPIGFDFADRDAISDVLTRGQVAPQRDVSVDTRDRNRVRQEHALTYVLVETTVKSMGETVLLEAVRDAQDVADRWEDPDLDLMLASRFRTLALREALVVLRDETLEYDPATVTAERELRLRRVIADVLLRFDQMILGLEQFAADVQIRNGRGGSRRTALTPWLMLRDAVRQIDHRITIDGIYTERRTRAAAAVLETLPGVDGG